MRVAIAAALMGLFVMMASAGAPISGIESQENQDVIVVFHDDVGNPAQVAADLTRAHGGQLGFVYEHALKGFSGTFSSRAVAAIERNPRVAYVELDQLAHTAEDQALPVPTGIDRVNADQNANLDIDGNDDLSVDAVVAVIDTGIDFQHSDLNVNTTKSVDCSGGNPFSGSCSTGGDDDNGHGTHVAGTIGALDDGPNYTGGIYTDVHVVGVAPGVEQWAVKVLRSDGSGYISWIVAGIDYVTDNADLVDVANMSLGCECSSQAMDDAIADSVAAGVTYAVAAGNSAKDASTFSPANHPDVIAVSALADFDGEPGALGSPTCRTDEDDTLANFSNFGSEVEVTAPGVCILSAWNDGGYNIISGTSMASPHAAGAAALLAASGVTSPSQISSTLQSTGNTEDWTDEIDGTEEPRVDVAAAAFNPDMTGTDEDSEPDTTPPGAPANLSAAAGDSQVVLDWDDNIESDLAGYNVYRSTTSGDYGDAIATGVTSSDYTDTELTNGTEYFYVVTAVDTSGNESAESNEASAQPEESSNMHVGDLDGNAVNNRSLWHAEVSIRVVDAAGQAVGDATVTGDWSLSTDGAGKTTCTTDSAGLCTVRSDTFMKSTGSVTWTVTDLSHGTLTYDSSANTDPDGDSDGTSITVSKP